MAPKTFEEFLYKGQPLDQEGPIPDDIAQCTTDMQKTGWIVKKLIACEYESVQNILAKHQEVRRLIKIKKVTVDGVEQEVAWDLDTAVHATAFAHQIFTGYEPAQPCSGCLDPNDPGPFAVCVVPDMPVEEAPPCTCMRCLDENTLIFPFPMTDAMNEALANEDFSRWTELIEEAERTYSGN